MTYTKKDRAEAIEACAMMASSNEYNGPDSALWFPDAIDVHSKAADLARCALREYPEGFNGYKGVVDGYRVDWAAAECLLREGWTP